MSVCSFVDFLCFLCLVLTMPLCVSVDMWSPAGKGLASLLSLWCVTLSLSLPGSGAVLDCIDS